MPVTRLNSRISSSVILRSARALMRCTVAISRSTSVSVISRSLACSSAASRVSRSGSGWVRTCEGASTAARARHAATTFGATSANRSDGSPTARTASSLPISASIDSRLTLPGSDLISASSAGPSASCPSSSAPTSSGAAAASSSSRTVATVDSRDAIRTDRTSSACRSAEVTIRSMRPAVGGSIRSA